MAIALLLLSFSTVLFTLVIFKLLSFFIMPSLFFDLLFIGFPVGAMLAAYFFQVDMKSFVRTIWILQLALILSTFAVLFAHNFGYLRVHLFDVRVSQLLINISIFALLFIPFFIAYGLSEYVGYQIGRQRFKARMFAVYALYLFGAAAAYLLSQWLVPLLGVTKLIIGTFMITAVVGLIISTGRARWLFWVQLLVASLGYFTPEMEAGFLRLYKGASPLSTAFFQSRGFDLVFQKWGRYSLTEIMQSPDSSAYYGFYNDFLQWEYYPDRGYRKPSLGTIPLSMMDSESKKLIIGSGGGRQVRFAVSAGHTNITAVEIEPAVIEAVRDPQYLLQEFQQVYDRPGVRIVQSEGRKYLDELQIKQDLIFMPSVGGYPQMMLEPGNMIRTIEAYQMVLEKLTPQGLFAIWYPAGLDSKGVLTDQYVRTLADLGMQVRAYRDNEEFLILSTPDQVNKLPESKDLLDLLVVTYEQAGGTYHSFPIPLIPADYMVGEDPSFQPVTDDKPYLGGNLRHIFSEDQVHQLYGFGAIVLILLGIFLYFLLKNRGDPRIAGRSYNSLAVLAFLLGANFLVVEHHLVLLLFKTNYVFHDALMMGAVIFLICTGLGSMIAASAARKVILWVALAGYLVIALAGDLLPGWTALVLIVPVSIATGSFFPLLFERAAKNPLGVFALDAVGAGVGSLLAASIPILFGFQFYGTLALLIFLITVVMDHWFHKSVPPSISA